MKQPKSLSELAREERDKVIWQLKCEGKTVRDICKIMNVALQTAQSAINRQRQKAKKFSTG